MSRHSDHAGKQYLEPPAVNTLVHWGVTLILLAVCAAMFLLPLWEI